ncbi:MAG TPA: acyl-CoA dehydrogenase family protein [Spirillospora sp.]|nr:acyl-CoA dehydrogenase family protein [Spirillospora sp.]
MTTDLADDLRALRGTARDHAADLRERALAVDAAPHELAPHLDCPGFRLVRDLLGEPLRVRRVTAALLELARGDAGMVLAAPGPALAGVVVALLGGPAHRERLAAAVQDGRTWAFMAVTEPDAGSDAARLRAALRPDGDGGYLLSGRKRYIGNGARGGAGVVFARTGKGPLSIRAALVDAPAPGLSAAPLGAIGLRGAGISEMVFSDVPVPGAALLGGHLPAAGRGLLGAVKAFTIVRVYVAAMAAGTARAVHETVLAETGPCGALDAAHARITAVERLVLRAAGAAEADPGDGRLASAAKLAAADLAVRACDRLPELLGPGALLDHPLLEKWRRDAAAFEFMEGTSHIQRLTIAHRAPRRARPAGEAAGG